MVKDNTSYSFNMGNNNINPFKKVLKVLMERDVPEVVHDRQMETIFFPETHLHNMPRVVDEQRQEKENWMLHNSGSWG